MKSAYDHLNTYLRDVVYTPADAVLDIDMLPEDCRDFGVSLRFFAECVIESQRLAHALSKGDLGGNLPVRANEISSPLKSLHASLKHLTWQAQRIAEGDYSQRVAFMGEFSNAFNVMIEQLEERKQNECREKARLQQYIDLLLTTTPNIIMVFDNEGIAVLASEAYIRRCNIASAEEIRGKSFTELFAPITSGEFVRHIESLMKYAIDSKDTMKTEQSIDFSREGDLRDYTILVTPMVYNGGTKIGTMFSFNDMTDTKQAQREAECARELAEQSTKAKSEFLARMSHEIRTPINAIIGMTAIGLAAKRIDKKDDSFSKVDEASKHLLGVINEILDMSKIEANKFELSYTDFHFRKMLDPVLSIIGMRIAEKKQKFIVNIDSALPTAIVADEQHLAQVIANLLSNAVKFTPELGTITLTAAMTGSVGSACTMRISVEDTGIGMSKEQQSHLFAPFEQADGSISRRFGGTGLGLSISKSIIEMMGGRIWVVSEIGKGSSFIIELTVQVGENTKEADASKFGLQNTAGIFKGNRVLIAEDVDINREIISAILEDTGVSIEFAENGLQAVECLKAAPDGFDLILMDIHMPEMDGYEATKCIRTAGHSIPIIAMTANVFREDIERCRDVGMNGHLGKPIDVFETISALSTYLHVRKDGETQ